MVFRSIVRKINLKLRRFYFKRHYLVKSIPTIISSNCLGGFIYHDANLKFTSPTINLTFDPIDFLNFCNHINYINDIKFEEINSVNDYPTAKMFFKDGSSSIVYFVHYKKYFDAVDKFMKRASRIGSNICLLFTVNELTDEIVDEFDKLPYKKYAFIK